MTARCRNDGSSLRRDYMPVMLKPQSTKVISPVMPLARGEQRKRAVLPTSICSTLRWRGARAVTAVRIWLKSPMPRAARVLMGPAEMALTRMFLEPRETAR